MLKGLITNPYQPQIQGTFKQGSFWIATDGFTCLYFNKKPNIPTCQGVDADLLHYLDIPVSARLQHVPDIDFMVGVKNKSHTNKRSPFPYELDKSIGLFVNPYYMLRIMKLLPDVTSIFYTSPSSPIVFVGFGDDYGMLLPVKHGFNSPYINHEGELINPNLGEEIIKEENDAILSRR